MTQVNTDFGLWNLWIGLGGGCFAGFVVMLGGVETKDVLSLA